MDITINVHQAFYPGASEVDNACALRALLDCLIALNLAYLKYHPVPSLYESGVVYGRTTIWEPTAALYLPNKFSEEGPKGKLWWVPMGTSGGKKRGDCKSLSAARIAELRIKGIEANPVFRFSNRPDGSGYQDFHILVQTPNGWEDPSRKLGMGKDELRWFR